MTAALDYFESQCQAQDARNAAKCPCEALDPECDFPSRVLEHNAEDGCLVLVSELTQEAAAKLAEEWGDCGIVAGAVLDGDGSWCCWGSVQWAN